MITRRTETTFVCDYTGCEDKEGSVFPDSEIRSHRAAREAGWSISPARVHCPKHRYLEQRPLDRPLADKEPPLWMVRLPKILELRAAGKTLEEIGTEYGVTRERVRQILWTAYARKIISDPILRLPATPLGISKKDVYRWLEQCGYRYCTAAKHAVCAATYGKCAMCRACNAARTRERNVKHRDAYVAARKTLTHANSVCYT